MPGVKNQHYVPRFYLRSFTDDSGYLSAVRRDASGLKPVFRTKPENVCAENYLYEVKRRTRCRIYLLGYGDLRSL